MAARAAIEPDDSGLGLALALVVSSSVPLLLLDPGFRIVAASASFCRAFEIESKGLPGRTLDELGDGEWGSPHLQSLIRATASGDADIDAYEMDLAGAIARRLVLNVKRIAYGEPGDFRLLVSVTDVTEARLSERKAADLARENEILLKEVRHRVANSLQIIASVLMQNARRTQSEETRSHLNDARQRVLSVAELEQHLAASTMGVVDIHSYLTKLCQTIGASMIADPAKLVLEVVAPAHDVDAGVSVSLGLIVTELVINALKHAFPRGAAGRIEVDYRRVGGGWALSVSDNGVGMPVGADVGTHGLGTSIVQALARQHRAQVVIEATNSGTKVTIAASPAAAVPAPGVAVLARRS